MMIAVFRWFGLLSSFVALPAVCAESTVVGPVPRLDVRICTMRKDAGMYFARGRAELRRSRFAADRGRIANQRRAVDATKLQRFVSLERFIGDNVSSLFELLADCPN